MEIIASIKSCIAKNIHYLGIFLLFFVLFFLPLVVSEPSEYFATCPMCVNWPLLSE